jgi:hypothetical protein
MMKSLGVDVKREAAMFGLILAVALISPLMFDQSPLNWISILFVALYLAQRVVHVGKRRAHAVRG